MALMKTNARTIVCLVALAVMATHLMSSADALDCYPINDCRPSSNGGVKCARMCALLNGPSGKAYCSGTTQCCCAPPGGRKGRLRTSAPLQTSDAAAAAAATTNEAAP
ncbi:uncharacterized protein LOC119345429 [Triticum dicoccoides]|uniref:uncharacterized protein LOC119345429 n=1 Tax=Triticum dicoccoides TaxID=85692 RepID=UPI0008426A4E|nr:uncharacterized protein LOC119345429 [Triticum dicoccoides]XP_044430156.1 uncharacterized protein LOC123156056 [Triticum aestivum]